MDIGMVVPRMREIAALCGTTNLKLGEVEDEIDAMVHGLSDVWAGESNRAYKQRWSQAQARMGESKTAIDKIRTLLEKSIDDLITADKKGSELSR